jgi:beta-galactosidase
MNPVRSFRLAGSLLHPAIWAAFFVVAQGIAPAASGTTADSAVSTMPAAASAAAVSVAAPDAGIDENELVPTDELTPVGGFLALRGLGRNTLNLNQRWRFQAGDVSGAEAETFDDSAWGEFATAADENRPSPEAPTLWFRRTFTLPVFAREGRFVLRLDAVSGAGSVWLNGQPVGQFSGKPSPATIDLEDRIRRDGSQNILAIRIQSDGNHPAGLEGPIWLVNTGDVYITDPPTAGGAAKGGVTGLVTAADAELATMRVRTNIQNDSDQARKLVVIQNVRPATANLPVQQYSVKVTLEPGENKTVLQEVLFKDPHLWTKDDPYMYHLDSRILESLKRVDAVRQPIALRSPDTLP